MWVIRRVEAFALKQGEDVLVAHQEVTGNKHKLKIGSIMPIVRCHGLEEALHGQALVPTPPLALAAML